MYNTICCAQQNFTDDKRTDLYTWSNVVHKCVGALKVDWIVYCVYNTSLNASVTIKCAMSRKEKQYSIS